MRERSARSECSYGKLSPYGFIKYQNSSHDVLVGMVIKLSGPLAHTNHVCGPELFAIHEGVIVIFWISLNCFL